MSGSLDAIISCKAERDALSLFNTSGPKAGWKEGYPMQTLQPFPENSVVSPERKAGMLSAASVLSSPYDPIAAWYDEGIRRGGSIHDLVLPALGALIGQTRG